MKKHLLNEILFFFAGITMVGSLLSQNIIKKYDIFELTMQQHIDGNPYRDVQFRGIFEHQDEKKEVRGFYDGDEKFIIRFMPDSEGTWSYKTNSNIDELKNHSGSIICVKNS